MEVQTLATRETEILSRALLIRRVEERLLELFATGAVPGTVHTCIGQELTGAVLGEFLRDTDTVFSNHRGHGHFLAVTGDVKGLIAEVMGRSTGVCGGRGGSQHLHRDGFFSSGVLGGTLPVAAGRALAHRLDGTGAISVVFTGDGALGEGVVYETLNIVSRWELPLLVVLEDNGYAQSTARSETMAGGIDGRAEAFGVRVLRGSTWDWRRLAETAEAAVSAVRDECRPLLLIVDTYRLSPHSKGDDHRDPDELADRRARDPLNILLADPGPEVLEQDRRARELVEDAVASALAAPPPPPRLPVPPPPPVRWHALPGDGRRVVEALRDGLGRLLASDPGALLLGEDVRDPYGGAFKATAGLSRLFGDRVRNTPVSEAALVGIGLGLAIGGRRPIVELMFGDFVTLAMDQLVNHCAKLPAFGPGVTADLVVRTPMGGGRGYGPTHSQTLDRHLLGVPGLRVVALNSRVDPGQVYTALLRSGAGPTLVIENKRLYTRRLGGAVPIGFRALGSEDDLPVVLLKPEATPDVTLVGYGGMLDELETAADELFQRHDVVAQVLCPTQVYPFRVDGVLDVLRAAGALVVAEEGQKFAGFGAELLAQLAVRDPRLLARARRVAAAPVPIPANSELEREALPGAWAVVAATLEVLHAP